MDDKATSDPRDRVNAPEGTRPQRSTEEHGTSTVERPGGSLSQGALHATPPGDHGPQSSDAVATPEGHSKEVPAPDEMARPGTPGAGHPIEREEEDGVQRAGAHADGDATSPGDEHADTHGDHREPTLGPIDWRAWIYSAVGVAAGVMVAAIFALVTLAR